MRLLAAAAAYGGGAFALGFLLGTVRVLVLAPRIGAVGATLAEAPLMLAACWFLAPACVRIAGAPGAAGRLLIGMLGFVTLQGLELVLAFAVLSRTAAEVLTDLATPAGALGLSAQLAFALIPWARGAIARLAAWR